LNTVEKAKLEMMTRRPKADQCIAARSLIVLDCASGLSNN
jgi:hypothetical protein